MRPQKIKKHLTGINKEEVNEATVQYVGDALGSLKARISCQTLFVENGKEMLLSDLQTVSSWALKNATLIADSEPSKEGNSVPFGYR